MWKYIVLYFCRKYLTYCNLSVTFFYKTLVHQHIVDKGHCTVVFVENAWLIAALRNASSFFSMLCLELILLFTLMKCVCCRNVTHPLQFMQSDHACFSASWQMMQVVSSVRPNHYFGFGPIPKPKPKLVVTFGWYRN